MARQSHAAPGTAGPHRSWWIGVAPDLAALVAFAIGGLAISIYLTTVHYAHVPLVCSVSGVVNCAQVTTSAYSVVPGTQLPITIPGMFWFLVSGGLAISAGLPQARNGELPVRICVTQVIWGAGGLVTVLYLIYVEVARLHAICEWCTAVHVLTLLTFLVALYRMQQLPDVAFTPSADQAVRGS